jgi:O-antigen/teichoic acid export membrane protein
VYPAALWLISRKERGIRFFSFRTDAEFWRYFTKLRNDAWHCFRSQVSIVVLYTIDIILVVLVCSPGEAAVYGILSRIFAILRGFLQSMSEISWPMIAQRGWGNKQLNGILNRMNAWAVGSVTGALCFTLGPFCGWYIGKAWAAPDYWVWLMAARFLVTSLAAPAAYLLYGAGDFRAISKYLERELVGGCALALVLGPLFGVAGIATAFLASTALGTLLPIYRAYGIRTGEPVTSTLLEIWTRAGAGLTISVLCTKLTLGYLAGGSQLVLAGALGFGAGLATCAAWSALRMFRTGASVSPGTVLRFMSCI